MSWFVIGSRTQPPGAFLNKTADKTDVWFADLAWLGGSRLASNVVIEVIDGVIASITEGGLPPGVSRLNGVVLPGLVNAHSHAFHRLLRGRTHAQGGDFWLWRNRMYELADQLTPESYEEIATAVYIEMAMAGITAVGEFHYVHHQHGGTPYDDPNEMGHALIRAARRAGIRICLLDAGYFRAGFDDRPLHPVQRRFRDRSVEEWMERVEMLESAYDDSRDVVVGLAPHSVRAVPATGLHHLAEKRKPSSPTHIHVSEQPAENRECVEATGMTPTTLLGESGLLGDSTTLVHATHLTPEDINLIGASSSGVCYCATTERDLADGLGPAAELTSAGAALSVGSDSHAVVDIFEEARGIEMHQRLLTGQRGVMSPVSLMGAATTGGARALGFESRGLVEGGPADFVVIDPDSPRLAGLDPLSVDSLIYAATAAEVTNTFVAGNRIVSDGVHGEWNETKRHLTPLAD